MRPTTLLIAIAGLSLACGMADDEEVVVTRAQFGEEWPLEVNSARLSCSDEGAVLRIGQKRYALDAAGLSRGLPDARQVTVRRPHPDDPAHAAAPADLAPLREACSGLAHVASGD